MIIGTNACRTNGHFAGIGLGKSDQVFQIHDRIRALNSESTWIIHQVADQIKTFPGKGSLSFNRNRDQVRRVQKTDGVTIWCGLGQFSKTNRATRAGFVRHNDPSIVAKILFDIGRNQTRDEIRSAAGCVGDDHRDGTFWIFRCGDACGSRKQNRERQPYAMELTK